jgi:hypothetical protein
MGQLRFRLRDEVHQPRAEWLRRAYVTGPDCIPHRGTIELTEGELTCQRSNPESGRFHIPWPVSGYGMPMVATATLCERPEPFELDLELARGKLNDVRNQASDWEQLGLEVPAEARQQIGKSLRLFARAATAQGDPAARAQACRESLSASSGAARLLSRSYTEQILKKRRDGSGRLPTLFGFVLDPNDAKLGGVRSSLTDVANAVTIRCSWAKVMSVEGKPRWDEIDAQIAWCRKRKILPMMGPLVEFRPSALPDGIWLWEGDFEHIQAQAVDYVRQAVTRYRGKVATWRVTHRVAAQEMLGLAEDEQIRLIVRLIQEVKRWDPDTPLVIDMDRPWAEWMTASRFQLGPLHLADTLARADLGMSGIGIELAPGWTPYGSHLRDAFEVSRLLDLYKLVDLPLHVTIMIPSATSPDSHATDGGAVDAAQWPAQINDSTQFDMGSSWMALAVAKPFVRSVMWGVASDANPGPFPHGGLLRADGSAKPMVEWMKKFRRGFLS